MTVHQANYGRILKLRETIDSLNQNITSNLTLLDESRKDLLAIPTTNFPENRRDIPYEELLDFATRISRYTVPPTLRPRIPTPQSPAANSPQPADSLSTNGASAIQSSKPPTTTSPDNNATKGDGIGVASLDQNEVQWLDPLKQIPFVPWPSEEIIRQGALAQIQVMLEQGIDPNSANVSQDEMRNEERNEDGTLIVKLDEKIEKSAPEPILKPGSNGILQVEKREEKPRVFGGLDLYDPDEG